MNDNLKFVSLFIVTLAIVVVLVSTVDDALLAEAGHAVPLNITGWNV